MNENTFDQIAERIIKNHPKLFKHLFHFECGAGWLSIIEKLADTLEPLIEDPDEYGCYTYATQVKEKYGTLRFYVSQETHKMSRLISKAESESAKICENCGKQGRLRDNGWRFVRCDDCWNKICEKGN